MHDIPYLKQDEITPETVAFMTKICCEIRRQIDRNMFMGIQILAGANEEALAVALASGMHIVYNV